MVHGSLTRLAGAALAAAALAGCATPAPPRTAAVSGYLGAEGLERLSASAASAPAGEESAPAEELVGLDRWWLATAHAELRPPLAAQHFDCVLGARLSARPRPSLARMMNRLLADASALAERLSETRPSDSRLRPFAAGLRPCVRVTDEVRTTPSWPSGPAIAAGAYGELMSSLAPDAATAVRRTAREIGFSRVVCRMNWGSDVEAGLDLGARLFEQAAEAPDFRQELEAARREVEAARMEGLSSPGCAAERLALQQWSAPDRPPQPPRLDPRVP